MNDVTALQLAEALSDIVADASPYGPKDKPLLTMEVGAVVEGSGSGLFIFHDRTAGKDYRLTGEYLWGNRKQGKLVGWIIGLPTGTVCAPLEDVEEERPTTSILTLTVNTHRFTVTVAPAKE